MHAKPNTPKIKKPRKRSNVDMELIEKHVPRFTVDSGRDHIIFEFGDIGSCLCRLSSIGDLKVLNLASFNIRVESSKKGVGETFLKMILGYAKHNKFDLIEWRSTYFSDKFYEKLGFTSDFKGSQHYLAGISELGKSHLKK